MLPDPGRPGGITDDLGKRGTVRDVREHDRRDPGLTDLWVGTGGGVEQIVQGGMFVAHRVEIGRREGVVHVLHLPDPVIERIDDAHAGDRLLAGAGDLIRSGEKAPAQFPALVSLDRGIAKNAGRHFRYVAGIMRAVEIVAKNLVVCGAAEHQRSRGVQEILHHLAVALGQGVQKPRGNGFKLGRSFDHGTGVSCRENVAAFNTSDGK